MKNTLYATLPHPPGLNATYKAGNGRLYKSAHVVKYQQDAVILLRMAGFHSYPLGKYSLDLRLTLATRRLDIDGPLKLLIDCIATCLGINDSNVNVLTVHKVKAKSKEEQRVYIQVIVTTIE